jgi:hypothetical protein
VAPEETAPLWLPALLPDPLVPVVPAPLVPAPPVAVPLAPVVTDPDPGVEPAVTPLLREPVAETPAVETPEPWLPDPCPPVPEVDPVPLVPEPPPDPAALPELTDIGVVPPPEQAPNAAVQASAIRQPIVDVRRMMILRRSQSDPLKHTLEEFRTLSVALATSLSGHLPYT